MRQEDRELLLKDLSTRLCYGVKVSLEYEGENLTGTLYSVYPEEGRVIVDDLSKAIAPVNVRCGGFMIEENIIKPYLRPMSSMTEEERKEYSKLLFSDLGGIYEDYWKAIDWLLLHHFDYRGLISLGLALEATSEIYPSNIKVFSA